MSKAKDLSTRFDDWMDSHKILSVVIAVVILVVICVGLSFLPDKGPDTIKNRLAGQGFNVEHITFEKIENDDFWSTGSIYRASEAIEYRPGVYVDEWRLSQTGYSTFTSYWSVSPYPELPSPVDINLRLSLSQADYDRLSAQAGEQTVEEYIRELVNSSVSAAEDAQ